ncbi:hypothetical protein H5410_004273 [Solanum commersonii]|uniref:Uncharacterized protein n=1 Tax=Solanum commersonii TaxID=4109 RepID=A0A9J6B7M8_SOLCO|nr:hypothetical protein H5410_004273 [Solanum commersonii]
METNRAVVDLDQTLNNGQNESTSTPLHVASLSGQGDFLRLYLIWSPSTSPLSYGMNTNVLVRDGERNLILLRLLMKC